MLSLLVCLWLVQAAGWTAPRREDFGVICEAQKFEVGVEIGVQVAVFSEHVLTHWRSNKRYYLVDMWRQQSNYSDGANVNNDEQEKKYQIAQRRMKRFAEKTVFMRNDSLSAALLVPDDSVDFIYVDARHDYCGVTEDLFAWWPKLKKGGLLAGHDFFTADEYIAYLGAYRKEGDDWGLCGNGSYHRGAVKGAVLDFARRVNVSEDSVKQTGHVKNAFPSWYFPPKGS